MIELVKQTKELLSVIEADRYTREESLKEINHLYSLLGELKAEKKRDVLLKRAEMRAEKENKDVNATQLKQMWEEETCEENYIIENISIWRSALYNKKEELLKEL